MNVIDSVIVEKIRTDELDWFDIFKCASLLHETVDEHRRMGVTLPDGLPSALGILTKILAVSMDKESTTAERKNALWRNLGLGKLTTDPKVRNIALAGCMEIMRRMGKSETDIEGSREFQLLGIPASAFKQARKEPVVIPDEYGERELPYFMEQLALIQQDLPKKGPSES